MLDKKRKDFLGRIIAFMSLWKRCIYISIITAEKTWWVLLRFLILLSQVFIFLRMTITVIRKENEMDDKREVKWSQAAKLNGLAPSL